MGGTQLPWRTGEDLGGHAGTLGPPSSAWMPHPTFQNSFRLCLCYCLLPSLSDLVFEHLSIPLTLPFFHFKGKEINSPTYLVYNLN